MKSTTQNGSAAWWIACLCGSALMWSAGAHAATSELMPSPRAIYDAQVMPDRQVYAYRNIDQLFPTRTVNRSDRVQPLSAASRPLDPKSLSIPDQDRPGTKMSLYEYISRNRVSGLLVIKNGRIAFEDYELGMDQASRWMSMSVAKSVTSTLIGAAIRDGYIKSIDDKLVAYMPELAGGAYANVTVRQLLLMSSGVKWNETYTDPTSDRRKMLELQLEGKPGTIVKFMSTLPRVGDPGSQWNYSTGETQIAGALVRAAVRRPVAEYLSEKIWAKVGMERDAAWWLDAPNGTETGGSGLLATLRDYGRFGLFVLNDGVVDGERVLPDGWMEEAGKPHEIGGKLVPYGYYWWPAVGKGEINDGAFTAAGIFGQFIYINPKEKLVVVQLSAQPKPVPPLPFGFFGAVAEALR